MEISRLGAVEQRFADLIWANAPLSSGDLVKLCQQELKWKKPTTYTVLRKLCERGLFQNNDGCVTAVISKEEYLSLQTEKFVEDTYAGSLPAFIAAFATRRRPSEQELQEIRRMLDEFGTKGE
jgi:predicted transcriptional regulator